MPIAAYIDIKPLFKLEIAMLNDNNAKNSLLSDASKRLEQALKHVDISEDAIARLQHPKTSLSVSIPVRMDNGSLKVFSGYRVRYDDTRGAGTGGVVFLPIMIGPYSFRMSLTWPENARKPVSNS